MRRLWHRLKAWFGIHPWVGPWLRRGTALVLAAVALIGVAAAFYFHGQDTTKIKDEKLARQAAAAAQTAASKTFTTAIVQSICPLVWAYVHPVAGTPTSDRSDQVIAGWHAIGALLGCPNGTPPKR